MLLLVVQVGVVILADPLAAGVGGEEETLSMSKLPKSGVDDVCDDCNGGFAVMTEVTGTVKGETVVW